MNHPVTTHQHSPFCTNNGEAADFWLRPKPNTDDGEMLGLIVFSLVRGLGSAMRGEQRGGYTCDIHPDSIIAIAARVRGKSVGPVVYAPNLCATKPCSFSFRGLTSHTP